MTLKNSLFEDDIAWATQNPTEVTVFVAFVARDGTQLSTRSLKPEELSRYARIDKDAQKHQHRRDYQKRWMRNKD